MSADNMMDCTLCGSRAGPIQDCPQCHTKHGICEECSDYLAQLDECYPCPGCGHWVAGPSPAASFGSIPDAEAAADPVAFLRRIRAGGQYH